MKTTPILYSTPMVQALQNDTKTQTRRTKGLKAVNENPGAWECAVLQEISEGDKNATYAVFVQPGNTEKVKCPYGAPGDILWVRETWALSLKNEVTQSEKSGAIPWYYNPDKLDIVFKADSKEETHPDHPEWGKKRWKSSIHMPKPACRLFLKIKNIRVERLQDITEADAVAEGIEWLREGMFWWRNYLKNPLPGTSYSIHSYQTLWQSINGPESWAANPWVWVVEFEKCEKPESFNNVW